MFVLERNTSSTPIDATNPYVRADLTNLVEEIADIIGERAPDTAGYFDLTEADELDYTVENMLLREFISFACQRQISSSEILDVRLLTAHKMNQWYKQVDSSTGESQNVTPQPVDESSPIMTEIRSRSQMEVSHSASFNLRDMSYQVEALETENARLKRENELLKLANKAFEEEAIENMRYKPSTRYKRTFSNLDDYIADALKHAVAEGIREVLNNG